MPTSTWRQTLPRPPYKFILRKAVVLLVVIALVISFFSLSPSVCNINIVEQSMKKEEIQLKNSSLPTTNENNKTSYIFFVTPTYKHITRIAGLTGIINAMALATYTNTGHEFKIKWILVEDNNKKDNHVKMLLDNYSMFYDYEYILSNRKIKTPLYKGAGPRNTALKHVYENYCNNLTKRYPDIDLNTSSLYFGDDDNIYAPELFTKYLSDIKNLGIWPVAFAGGMRVEGPTLDSSGKFKSWHTNFAPYRKYGIDMAGFALNLQRLCNMKIYFPLKKPKNRLFLGPENEFLISFNISLDDAKIFESVPPTAKNSRVYVWHTQISAGPHTKMGKSEKLIV